MANTVARSLPSRSVTTKSQPRKRPRFAVRRRLLLLLLLLTLVGVAILANYGPLEAYRDARARLEQASSAVSTLDEQKSQLQSELGRLSETGYLEGLAREELTYTRPGEQLYIVTGLEEATGDEEDASSTDAGSEAERPGLFERALSAILGIF